MSSSDPLQQYLSETRASGEQDSEGGFTIDASKARSKMSASALESPADYLTKVLQAAHTLGSDEVQFKITAGGVRANFSFPFHESVLADRLADAIHRGDSAEPATRHLALALQAAGGKSATWRLGRDHFLRVADEQIDCQAGPVEGSTMQATFETARRGNFVSRILQRSARAEEQKTLYERGQYSHLIVKVDGRPVEQTWPREVAPFLRGHWLDYMTVAPYYLMEGYLDGEGLSPFLFPRFSLARFEPVSDGLFYCKDFKKQVGDYFKCKPSRPLAIAESQLYSMDTLFRAFPDHPPGSRIGAAFAVPMTLAGPSSLFFVLDGATLRAKSVKLALPGMLAVVSGEGLGTDISGLSIIEDAAYQERLLAVQRSALRFADLVRSRQGDYLIRSRELSNARSTPGQVLLPMYHREIHQGILSRLGS